MTDPNKLLELAERAEQATADQQRYMLLEACRLVKPEWWELGKPVKALQDFVKWCGQVDAEAYESAALSLLPNGAGLSFQRYWIASVADPVWSAEIYTGGILTNPRKVFDCYDATTPALALVAAILRAMAAENDNGI